MIPPVERLQVQAFVPQRPVETLVDPVLPRAARVDVPRRNAVQFQHVHQELRDELRAVVAADVARYAASQEQESWLPDPDRVREKFTGG